ncbi:rhodanese-like domain-containing protein [Candidatus Deianiraea vastatrix]|uniref:YgaP-like rhodanese domain protein n=1 Tax=Candidatus Deianiraea vastatrix TaxID=2163644 RepID=A0A5B8XGP9_9RICK|nr:rhodanese-like domain-containing protein [Candidatus Deianiraea vastatrix]QED23351.1 Putative YgaP-like rhodanese domain protein [Candidatus Deianiraea vastatrix]
MKQIQSHELNDLIKNNEVVIVDVREPFEHKSCHIKDSILIPSSCFDEAKIPNISDKKIVIHCKSGRRASLIIDKMKNKNCFNLEGGIDAWIAQGFDVEKSSKKCLPLDRQVQLTIGIILIASFFLTYFININFVFIALLIGCGLSFAGLTGYCGLAMVLAKAPWNKVYADKNIKSCKITSHCCN